ncbi:flagellar hook-length control protein FliK [Hoeflea sp. AS60]|uniref:flagellar hook-length control protein FliK n=1 Tax=Hoeflea sp. AS60 TaxID=3135780 RepID=UPI00316D827F
MSALDMVLQRQVPARTAAKTGEGSSGADTAADTRNDAFSAALSQEKRSAATERDKVELTDEPEVGANIDDPVGSDASQSDDILNLLAGLMSSASYSDDAELGTVVGVDGELAEAAAAVEAEAAITEDADAAIPLNTNLAATIDGNAAGAKETAKVAVARNAQVSAEASKEASDAEAVAAAKTAESQTGQTSVTDKSTAPAPATLVSAAGGALAVQGTPAQPKSTDSVSERQKAQAAVKDGSQTVGGQGEAEPADAEVVQLQTRVRNTGNRQSDAADRRIEERAGSKDGKVEVIESRRFMPVQNMTANGQLLTRSLVDASSAALATQRAAAAAAQPAAGTAVQQTGQTLHTLKLQLNPVSLGSVTAILKLSGDELSVEIKVQTAEAYRQVKEDNQAMIKALRGQGFGVEQITVQHVTGPDRSSSQTPQQGFQAGQQGPGSSDAQSSGRESGRNNAGQQGSGSQGGQGHEQGSYTGSGTGRTDGVYL